MSFDLYFWRQTKAIPKRPSEICGILGKDGQLEGIAVLNVEELIHSFSKNFQGIQLHKTQLLWEGYDSYFLIDWSVGPSFGTTTMVTMSCGHGLVNIADVMNNIIDACHVLGCAVYDPQIDKRFLQPDGVPS